MTEFERIQALLAEGKITEEEAAMLLDALDAAERQSEAVSADDDSQPFEASHPVTEGPEPSGESEPQPKAWIKTTLSAASLEVSLDPSLTEPSVESEGPGEVELKSGEEGWTLRIKAQSGVRELRNLRVFLKLPGDYGLDLKARAGSVKLTGIEHLKGELTAGNLLADKLSHLAFAVKAGNVKAGLLPTFGKQHLDMQAGSASLHFLSGSDVDVNGKVKVGVLKADGNFEVNRDSYTNSRFNGTLGRGRAHFDIIQKAGTLKVSHD